MVQFFYSQQKEVPVLLRHSHWIRAATIAMLVLGIFSCKPRNSESGVKAEAYAGDYHGPNMSAASCVADPAACNCKLSNEFDAPDWKGKKEWFRQCIGQEIWYKATGGGGRFHGYFSPQKLGVYGDYGWVLHTDERGSRFDRWGMVNDPDCCVPDTPGTTDGTCRKKYPNLAVTKEDTYGFDYCPGDDVLLKYVGDASKDFSEVDPACNISKLEDKLNFKVRIGGGDDSTVRRSDSCYLAFGTSSGSLNLRKFPNPRFDKEKWRKLNNGSLWSWENFSRRRPGGGPPDYSDKGGKQRLEDASVEPPFLMGQSCGTCHIGFNPLHPPVNPNEPSWENVHGVIGNIFVNMTGVLGSGTRPGTLEHEAFLRARAGVVDTSAATNDYTHNDGTFNAIINFDRRPGFLPDSLKDSQGATFNRFMEDVTTYRQQPDSSWKETTETMRVAHILKGGEDSIAGPGGVQRVYINIFSCTATCLANHLDDVRTLDGRSSRQTPFEFDQCRRDCPSYAAIEDRVYDEIDFLMHVRPTDLKKAKDPEGIEGGKDGGEIIKTIMEKAVEGGAPGSWYEAGKQIFATKCAKCHSSHPGQNATAGLFDGSGVNDIDVNKFMANFEIKDANDVRLDWLGSDVLVPQKLPGVGTSRCRALHSNHMEGHLWEAYASDTYKDKARYADASPELFDFKEENLTPETLGGRGFYRNISLLSLWAHAPFMHNNGVGWEWRSGLFDLDAGSVTEWQKMDPNPSVKQRLRMFKESMNSLFLPSNKREHTGAIPYKVNLSTSPISIFVAPTLPEIPTGFWSLLPGVATLLTLKDSVQNITIEVPKGLPVKLLSSLRHKQIFWDMMEQIKTQPTVEKKVLAARAFLASIFGNGQDAEKIRSNLIAKKYVNCADIYDNRGHEISLGSQTERDQLTDFLLTL